eukprot:15496808-Heterocapsa_arctica.AAC.1
MCELVIDGERGFVESLSAGLFLARHGIKVIPRAPEQNARYIERRGELLRDVLHRIDSQLERE